MSYLSNGDEKLKDFFREYLRSVSLQYVVDCVHILSVIDGMPLVEESICSDDVIGLLDVARGECVRRVVMMADRGAGLPL